MGCAASQWNQPTGGVTSPPQPATAAAASRPNRTRRRHQLSRPFSFRLAFAAYARAARSIQRSPFSPLRPRRRLVRLVRSYRVSGNTRPPVPRRVGRVRAAPSSARSRPRAASDPRATRRRRLVHVLYVAQRIIKHTSPGRTNNAFFLETP